MTTATKARFTPLSTPLGVVRQPTAEECDLVGRERWYSEPYESGHGDWRDLGDYVIETRGDDLEGRTALAEACLAFAIGDDAHVIPAGVYVEE